MNIWKIATIIEIVIIISLLGIIFDNQNYEFAGFKIPRDSFSKLSKAIEKEYSSFVICNIHEDKCISVASLK